MASKVSAKKAKRRDNATPKSNAQAKPAITKSVPAPENQEKLVSKIVTVSNTPIRNGNQTMTKTTETITAKAKDVIADLKVHASTAAEKGKKIAVETYTYSKENVAAVVETGKLVAKGTQEISAANVEFAKSNYADLQAAVKEVTAVRTPADFVKVQSELTKKSIDTAMAQSAKNTEAMIKMLGEVFQPISNRVAVSSDLFKKVA